MKTHSLQMMRSVTILNLIRHPELDSGQTNTPSNRQRCCIQLDPGSSPG